MSSFIPLKKPQTNSGGMERVDDFAIPAFLFFRNCSQHSSCVHPPEPQLKQYTANHDKKKAEGREKIEEIRLDVYQVLYEVEPASGSEKYRS